MARVKLTNKVVRGLEATHPKGTRSYDSLVREFGITCYPPSRKHPRGSKVFFVRSQTAGKRVFRSLGSFPDVTVDEARKAAKAILRSQETGKDPLGCPTWRAWVQTYMAEIVDLERKRSTAQATRRLLGLSTDAWGSRSLTEIKRADVTALRLQVRNESGVRSANRWLSAVRVALDEALARGFIEGNPASGIKRIPEPGPRQRTLSDDEMGRLAAAVAELTDPRARIAFQILMTTGCRRSEALTAKWEDIDLDAGVWRLPETKSGHPQHVLLPPGLVELLRATPRMLNSPWLVPSAIDPKRHKHDIHREWKELCAAAEIEGAVPHDLRRTHGKRLADEYGLRVAQRALRHASSKTTSDIYAPVNDDELRDAVDAVVIEFPKAKGSAEIG